MFFKLSGVHLRNRAQFLDIWNFCWLYVKVRKPTWLTLVLLSLFFCLHAWINFGTLDDHKQTNNFEKLLSNFEVISSTTNREMLTSRYKEENQFSVFIQTIKNQSQNLNFRFIFFKRSLGAARSKYLFLWFCWHWF